MAMWFGGDYNPEQWDAATVEEDIRLMREMRGLRDAGRVFLGGS